MVRKSTKPGEVNKSQTVWELLKENPAIKAGEVIDILAKRGINVNPSTFYLVKGQMKGKKGRRKKARQMVEKVTATMSKNGVPPKSTGDVVSTILKVKHLAAEVGGLKKLKTLVDALNE